MKTEKGDNRVSALMPLPFSSQMPAGKAALVAVDLGHSRNAPTCGIAVSGRVPCACEFGEAIRMVNDAILEIEKTDPVVLVLEAPLSAYYNGQGNPDYRGDFERGRGWYYGSGATVYVSALMFLKFLADKRGNQKPLIVAEAFLSHKTETTSDKKDAEYIRDKFWECKAEPIKQGMFPASPLVRGVPSIRVFSGAVASAMARGEKG